jgi:hypothetical protein
MPITAQQDGAMSGGYSGLPTNLKEAAYSAVHELDYPGLWGPPGTLTPAHPTLARLALAGYDAGGWMILKVLIQNVPMDNTLATVKVAPTAKATSVPGPTRDAQRKEIVRVIKHALGESLNDFRNGTPHTWHVTGTPSS